MVQAPRALQFACGLKPAIHKARGQAASITKRLQEGLCYGRVARRAPMTVGKKMNRTGGQHVVEIDADIRKLAKDHRGKAELRSEEIAGALMGQDNSHAARYFIPDSTEDEADDLDRLTGIQALGSRRLDEFCDDRGHEGPVAPAFPHADGRRAKNIRAVHLLEVGLCSTDETPSQYVEVIALIEHDQDGIARLQKVFPISESHVLLVGSVAHGAGVDDACAGQGGKHFDVEAIFDVYAFAERQRVAEDQNPASGARILRNEPLAVLISSDAPLFAGRIDPRRQEIRRIAPSRLRIGPEQVIAFGNVARIESQGCFRSDGRHCHGAEEKSCPMQGHSHLSMSHPRLFRIINGRPPFLAPSR
jgi:hypothetical protein